MIKAISRVFVAAVMFALAFGCARSDWIEQTLVTVDVTGTWRNVEGGLIELTLEQRGAKVTGSLLLLGLTGVNRVSGSIEGTVTGDIFRFRLMDGRLEGELTVGDEMKGSGRVLTGQGRLERTFPIRLQRIS